MLPTQHTGLNTGMGLNPGQGARIPHVLWPKKKKKKKKNKNKRKTNMIKSSETDYRNYYIIQVVFQIKGK